MTSLSAKRSKQPFDVSEEIDVEALSPVELRVSGSVRSTWRNSVLANSAQMSSAQKDPEPDSMR
eukprot:scaffold219577_cov51-Attheya_sp.AAC.2